MFDKIETKSEVSVSQMIANLRHNQEALQQWSENLVTLAERGLDQGLLQQLRDAGPESLPLWRSWSGLPMRSSVS